MSSDFRLEDYSIEQSSTKDGVVVLHLPSGRTVELDHVAVEMEYQKGVDRMEASGSYLERRAPTIIRMAADQFADGASRLTAAEWANWRRARAMNDTDVLETILSLLARASRWTAIAALVLDGQPDGFTGADVADVITAAGDERHVAVKGGPAAAPARELAARLDAIAPRLARLRAPDAP